MHTVSRISYPEHIWQIFYLKLLLDFLAVVIPVLLCPEQEREAGDG
jgi:hypothetical protein